MDQIHTPERLENETQAQYRSRRRIAKLVANRGRVVVRPGEVYAAPKQKLQNRLLSKHLGARQAKKLKRLVAETRRAGGEAAVIEALRAQRIEVAA